jgi:hypothetical protein
MTYEIKNNQFITDEKIDLIKFKPLSVIDVR